MSNWLWDRKITDGQAKRILKDPDNARFPMLAALLLARNNQPKVVFREYLDPHVFYRRWPAIKRRMRQDDWNNPRILFWQAIFEHLSKKYRKEMSVEKEPAKPKDEICAVAGRAISAVRREQGLSQKDLARKMGVSQQLISRIEGGKENSSIMTLANIAAALGKKTKVEFI